MDLDQITRMARDVEESEIKAAKIEGLIQAEMSTLDTSFGIKTIEGADNLVATLGEQLADIEAEAEEKYAELVERFYAGDSEESTDGGVGKGEVQK